MNLLIVSAGRRCELVKFFRAELNPFFHKVIALDINEFAPGLYFADKHYVIEKDFDNPAEYIKHIIRICLDENVSHILTLVDPELVLFAENRALLAKNGITPVLSADEVIHNTFDKYSFFKTYKDTVNVLDSCETKEEAIEAVKSGRLDFPVMAKPRCGSGSAGLTVLHYLNEFDTLKYNSSNNYIFQKKLDCREFGIDAYFDMITGELVSIFMKEKIALRSGETDKAVSVFREDIYNEVLKLEKLDKFRGPVDIDIFVDKDENIFFNEINPRFGGGYPMGHNCGVNFMKLVFNNMKGNANSKQPPDYKLGVKMMKYNHILFVDGGHIYND